LTLWRLTISPDISLKPYLVNLSFEQKQLNQRRRVLNGLFDDGDGLVVLLLEVGELAQEVVKPEQGRRRFEGSVDVVRRKLDEVILQPIADGLDGLELGRIDE